MLFEQVSDVAVEGSGPGEDFQGQRRVLLPFRTAACWLIAALVVLGLPVTSWFYWPKVLAAGVLPSEDDSIMVPQMGALLLSLLLAPVVLLVTVLCSWQRPRTMGLFRWDCTRPIVSSLVSAAFGICVVAVLVAAIGDLRAPVGWYASWWLPYDAVVLLWLLSMRALALEGRLQS